MHNCKMNDSKPLFYLEGLQYLDIQDNFIASYEDISPFLSTMRCLKELKIKGNPITQEKKFRDMVILFNQSLNELDDKTITPQEKKYIL